MAWLAAAGTLGGAAISSIGMGSANKTNVGFQRDLTQHQTNMANTAHQRQVHDLRQAGLNPILSASRGAGNVPGGATGAKNKFADAPAASRAAAIIGSEIKNLNAQSAKNNADAALQSSRKQGQDLINKKLEAISKPFDDASGLYDTLKTSAKSGYEAIAPELLDAIEFTLNMSPAQIRKTVEQGGQSAKDMYNRYINKIESQRKAKEAAKGPRKKPLRIEIRK